MSIEYISCITLHVLPFTYFPKFSEKRLVYRSTPCIVFRNSASPYSILLRWSHIIRNDIDMPAYEMDRMQGGRTAVEQEPISPLSPRSEAILAQRNSMKPISPPQSPSAPYPLPQGPKISQAKYTLPPKAYVMPRRKPLKEQPKRNKETAQHTAGVSIALVRNSIQSRPRSQSFRPPSELVEMPTGFLQDFTNHAPAGHAQQSVHVASQNASTGRSRSQTLPYKSNDTGAESHRCAACGRLQANSQQGFINCKKCINVYYCTVEVSTISPFLFPLLSSIHVKRQLRRTK